MELVLNPHEARVLGVLIEKAFTTPDQYPLSLNAITNGSNQRSNRDPVLDVSEAEVVVALQGLRMKQLAGSSFPSGSRVEKWRHNASEHLGLDGPALAVLAELLLRGPQAPGELRSRVNRMQPVASLDELGALLERLAAAGRVERRAPLAGSRAERYAQRLAPTLHLDGEPEVPTPPAPPPRAPRAPAPRGDNSLEARVESLEGELAELRQRFEDLARSLGEALDA